VSQQDALDDLHEQVAALEARGAAERVKLARRGAHRQSLVEEHTRTREQHDAASAAHAQVRADPAAPREAREASALSVATHQVMVAGAEADVAQAAADELAQQQEVARVDAALAAARREIRKIELQHDTDTLVVAGEVERIWAGVLEAPAHALPSGLNTFEAFAAGIGAKEGELRALGVSVVSLDRGKYLLPLWAAEAAKGHAPPVGTDMFWLRNSIERTAKSPVHGLPEMTTALDVTALYKHLSVFGPQPPVHVAKFRARVAALRPLRTLRELEQLELREAAEQQAERARAYVPPERAPRPPSPGHALGHDFGTASDTSPMAALRQRYDALQVRIAASAARLAAKVKP
jgi:hypothetical protein